MKILLLFLFSFSAFSQQIDESKLDKAKLAKKYMMLLDAKYKAVDSECASAGYTGALLTKCLSQQKALEAEFRYKVMITDSPDCMSGGYDVTLKAACEEVELQSKIDRSRASIANEAKCRAWAEQELDKAGKSYSGDETCDELKFALKKQ